MSEGSSTSTMFHAEFGDGRAVVALHGWAPDHRLMTGCLEPIFRRRGGYRRLYPDLPGMGRSAAGTVASSDDLLAAVEAFIDDQVGDEPFLLVGESYGGYLVRALARSRAEQVLGVAQICPMGEPLPERRVLPDLAVLRVEQGALDGAPAEVAESFSELAVVHTAAAFRRFQQEVQPGLDAMDGRAMARIREHWLLTDDPDDAALEPFGRPSLVLLGRQDVAVGYQDQLAMLQQFPRATMAIVDVAGHNLQIEQPELFAALVNEWLDRVEAEC